MSGWLYGGVLLETPPEGAYGFIYKITDGLGRVYFGKKSFEHSKKKVLSKKARKLAKTRKRIEKTKVDSGWMDYWGSSKPFLSYLDEFPNRRNMCKREILRFCNDKVSLSYHETRTLIYENVLFRDDCWNGNIAGKYFKGKIHG